MVKREREMVYRFEGVDLVCLPPRDCQETELSTGVSNDYRGVEITWNGTEEYDDGESTGRGTKKRVLSTSRPKPTTCVHLWRKKHCD
jgi:hypothetical protein